MVKAYEEGYYFDDFVEAIRDSDPELALAAIEFWKRFIMSNPIEFTQLFVMRLFAR